MFCVWGKHNEHDVPSYGRGARAYGGHTFKTFRDCAESYLEHGGGGNGRYIRALIEKIGDRPITAIYPFDVEQPAKEMFPHQKNATRNRSVISPIRSVFHHAYKRGWGPYVRFTALREDPPPRKKAATQVWLHTFVRQCIQDNIPHMAALVLFMSQTGARVSEAVRLEWPEVDLVGRTVVPLKTKTGTNSSRCLTDDRVARLYKLKETAKHGHRVFQITNRHSVNERIAAVFKRAGITYKPSHTCGRHAFAMNSLALGVDIKSTMDAGDWKSPVVFLNTYVSP